MGPRLDATRFELTEDHLKLARRMFVDWDDSCYEGAPAVGIKRPYGNSDVVGDIYEILHGAMWDYDAHGDLSLEEADPEEHERLLRIHREMEIVVQILLSHAGQAVVPGTYLKRDRYLALSWVMAS